MTHKKIEIRSVTLTNETMDKIYCWRFKIRNILASRKIHSKSRASNRVGCQGTGSQIPLERSENTNKNAGERNFMLLHKIGEESDYKEATYNDHF